MRNAAPFIVVLTLGMLTTTPLSTAWADMGTGIDPQGVQEPSSQHLSKAQQAAAAKKAQREANAITAAANRAANLDPIVCLRYE